MAAKQSRLAVLENESRSLYDTMMGVLKNTPVPEVKSMKDYAILTELLLKAGNLMLKVVQAEGGGDGDGKRLPEAKDNNVKELAAYVIEQQQEAVKRDGV